jgi:hypothetical protein
MGNSTGTEPTAVQRDSAAGGRKPRMRDKAGSIPSGKSYWEIMRIKMRWNWHWFSTRHADRVNVILLWSIMPLLMLTYFFMYYYFQDAETQWYTLFVSRQAQIFMMAVIIWQFYKNTRHAAIATSNLILSIFELLLELFGVSTKGSVWDVAWKLFIISLFIYSINSWHKRRK